MGRTDLARLAPTLKARPLTAISCDPLRVVSLELHHLSLPIDPHLGGFESNNRGNKSNNFQPRICLILFFFLRERLKDASEHVSVRRVCDHRPPHARMGTPHRHLELPCVPRGTHQPPALHNNPTCFPIGVSKLSRHSSGGLQGHCVILLRTERSGTDEFRKTIILPLRHPSDIFHLHPTTPGTFGPCASSQH